MLGAIARWLRARNFARVHMPTPLVSRVGFSFAPSRERAV
jgi:hypothetical protein